jgi:hypothetical protein
MATSTVFGHPAVNGKSSGAIPAKVPASVPSEELVGPTTAPTI